MAQGSYAGPTSQRLYSRDHHVNFFHTHLIHVIARTSEIVSVLLLEGTEHDLRQFMIHLIVDVKVKKEEEIGKYLFISIRS